MLHISDIHTLNRPFILGHRGSPCEAQENSLESFRRAIEAGADGVELDVRQTRDGVLILFHDETSCDGGLISGLTFAELQSEAKKAGLNINTAEEAFRELSGKGIINIEIKEAGYEEKVLTLARNLLPKDTYLVSSFLPGVIAESKRIAHDIPTIFITETKDQLDAVYDLLKKISASGVAYHHSLIDEPLAGFFRARNIPLFTWTVNDVAEAKRFAKMGIAGIITDMPGKLSNLSF